MLLQQMVDGAGVVFVPVGDDDAAHPVAVLQQVLEIGDDVIDPQHVVFGEHQAGVYDEQIRRRIRRPSCSCQLSPNPPRGMMRNVFLCL